MESNISIGLPEEVERILNKLENNGYEAYAVGGCVRDSILGRVPGDWDITTSAPPWQVKQLFRRTVDTGLQHGTVTVLIGKTGFEVTTYRIDGIYEDGRHPKEVVFTPNLLEDLKRRDFTINAMAYNERKGLIDAFGGLDDLKKRVVRCVGEPKDRFQEDALRMLRAVRFAAQLDFTVDPDTRAAVNALAGNLCKISAERIQAELVKLLVSDHPEKMRDVYELGISKVILPEFDAMMETGQNHPHHCCTVGEHTLRGMCCVPAEKVLRLAMLLHDVGKPFCKNTDQKGIDHFYGHPQKGAELAQQIFRRLKFDRETMERVCALVRWHDDNPKLDERSVRRAVIRVGYQQYPALFAVKRADILAQSEFMRSEKLAYVDAYEQVYEKIMSREDCLTVKQLAVTGTDLIQAGVPQGKKIGEVLRMLLELVVENPEKNTKEQLMEQVYKKLNLK